MRVIGQVPRVLADYQAGHGTLLDLASAAEEAAAALDKASAPQPHLLLSATNDLEAAYFASEAREHAAAAQRALAPVREALKSG